MSIFFLFFIEFFTNLKMTQDILRFLFVVLFVKLAFFLKENFSLN